MQQRVIGTPLPYSCIERACAAVAITGDVVFDKRAVGGPGNDAIAADIVNVVAADDDVKAGEPVVARPVVALAGDGGAVITWLTP